MTVRPWVPIVACAVLLASGAHAATSFELQTVACRGIDAARLRHYVTLELDTTPLPRAASMARITVACDGDAPAGPITLDIDASGGALQVRRRLQLPGAEPDTTLRWLALTIAETARWATSIHDDRGAVAAPLPSGTEIIRAEPAITGARASSPAEHAIGIYAIAETRHHAGTFASQGAGLGFDVALAALHVWTDVIGQLRRDDVPLGRIDSVGAHAAAGLAWVRERRRLLGRIAIGARAGVLRMTGAPNDAAAGAWAGSSLTKPWAGPLIDGSVGTHAGALTLQLGAEAGWALLGFSGDAGTTGGPVRGVSGGWVAARLAIGIRP